MNPSDSKLPIEDAIRELQWQFNREDLTPGFNLVTRLGTCEEQIGPDTSCENQAIIQVAELNVCTECKHKQKNVVIRRCLLHHLNRVERWVDPQTSLFGTDDGEVPADHVAHGSDADEAARKIAEHRRADDSTFVDGKSGKVHTEFAEDPDAPGMCACGWEMASEAPRDLHDRRHLEWRKESGRYVEGETPRVADVTAARSRRAKAGAKA